MGNRRDQVIIGTKFGHPGALPEGQRGGDPAWIRQAIDASLTRLNTDRIDHYQLHMPDAETPQAETLGALQELVDEGKVLEIGCSNFSADQIDECGRAPPTDIGAGNYASVQNHYSVLTRSVEDDGVIDACERASHGGGALLPPGVGAVDRQVLRADHPAGGNPLVHVAGSRCATCSCQRGQAWPRWSVSPGSPPTRAAASWNWPSAGWPQTTAVSTVICGATKPSQVASNVAAASWAMSADQRAEIAALA